MSAADQAYWVIRQAILDGAFAQGERLPEEKLVDACGVSRTPVREALRRLVVEGFVEIEPRQSARVASWTWEEIEEVFDLRSVLESHGARLAAKRATNAHLEALRRHAAAIEDAYADRDESFEATFTESNAAFHRTVIEAAHRPRLAQVVSQLSLPPMIFRTLDLYDDQAIQRSLAQHRELIAALEAGDERWAGAVMEA
ncbi:MAG: GntR family transcriptional regulator, partial [Caulobacterales bacterium]|nr:GntR family transcriptional regulator [Caulobacterales bacterium]